MALYGSDQNLFSGEDERNDRDILAVVSCAQKLIDANDRVLAAFSKGRREQDGIKEAVAAIQAKQDDIVAALSKIQQTCSPSQSPGESRSQQRSPCMSILLLAALLTVLHKLIFLFSFRCVAFTRT